MSLNGSATAACIGSYGRQSKLGIGFDQGTDPNKVGTGDVRIERSGVTTPSLTSFEEEAILLHPEETFAINMYTWTSETPTLVAMDHRYRDRDDSPVISTIPNTPAGDCDPPAGKGVVPLPSPRFRDSVPIYRLGNLNGLIPFLPLESSEQNIPHTIHPVGTNRSLTFAAGEGARLNS